MILAILTILVLERPEGYMQSGILARKLLQIDTARIKSISIRTQENSLTMERSPAGWLLMAPVTGPASTGLVDRLLSELTDLEVKATASTNTRKYPLFQLDPGQRSEIVLGEEGKKPMTILVGKEGKGWNELYIVRPEGPEVILATGMNALHFRRAIKEWREKRIFSIEPAQVKKIGIWSSQGKFEVELLDSVWKIGSDTASSNKVEFYLRQFSPMMIDDFADEGTKAPQRKDLVISLDGTDIECARLPAGSRWLVKIGGRPERYYAEEWRIRLWQKSRTDLLP